jgi:hypothetical protein
MRSPTPPAQTTNLFLLGDLDVGRTSEENEEPARNTLASLSARAYRP